MTVKSRHRTRDEKRSGQHGSAPLLAPSTGSPIQVVQLYLNHHLHILAGRLRTPHSTNAPSSLTPPLALTVLLSTHFLYWLTSVLLRYSKLLPKVWLLCQRYPPAVHTQCCSDLMSGLIGHLAHMDPRQYYKPYVRTTGCVVH